MTACGYDSPVEFKVGVRILTYMYAVALLICTLSGSSLAGPITKRGSMALDPNVCSPMSAELSCIVGCFKCAQAFGRKNYEMTMCCAACQKTKALFIDDGPEYCSSRFFAQGIMQG